MQNKKMAAIFHGQEDKYPRELEKRFPRILDKIAELWGKPELEAYFDDLLLDRRGNRQGFPPEVSSEIFFLNTLHGQEGFRQATAAPDDWGYELAREGLDFFDAGRKQE